MPSDSTATRASKMFSSRFTPVTRCAVCAASRLMGRQRSTGGANRGAGGGVCACVGSSAAGDGVAASVCASESLGAYELPAASSGAEEMTALPLPWLATWHANMPSATKLSTRACAARRLHWTRARSIVGAREKAHSVPREMGRARQVASSILERCTRHGQAAGVLLAIRAARLQGRRLRGRRSVASCGGCGCAPASVRKDWPSAPA